MVEAAAGAEVRPGEDVGILSTMFYFAAKPNIFNIERGALDPPDVVLHSVVINWRSN